MLKWNLFLSWPVLRFDFGLLHRLFHSLHKVYRGGHIGPHLRNDHTVQQETVRTLIPMQNVVYINLNISYNEQYLCSNLISYFRYELYF